MIIAIVFALILILAVLLVDWPKFLKRTEKVVSSRSQAGKQRRTAAAPQEEIIDDFPMEPVEMLEPVEEKPGYTPSPEVADLLSEADIHFRKGEMKAAENLYLQAAAKDPRCSKAYSRLGVIYLENGEEWEDAEAAFRQALKTDADNGFIYNNLGLVLYHQDKFADSIRNFEQAVRIDEQNASRHANLGMAYMAMRQYAKAESSFKKALKLAPNEMEYKDLLSEAIEKKQAHKSMLRR